MKGKITPWLGLLSIFCLLITPVSGSVQHQVTFHEERTVLNSTLVLKAEEPTNYWRMVWNLPSGSQLIEIRDSRGEIDDYQLEAGQLTFKTNTGRARKQEKVFISAELNAASSYFGPLAQFDLSLSAFPNESTYVELAAPDLISWSTPFGFQASLSESEHDERDVLKLAGEGPLSVFGFYLTANDSEIVASEHFLSVQGYNFSAADQYYPWLAGIAGFYPDFETFPVVVLPDSQYRAKADAWSMGTYEEGGIILLRNATVHRRSNLSILLHEAMHGFNAKALRWDRTDVAWFDEGVAKFVEFLVNSKRGVPQAQIFGQEYYFDRDGKSFYLEPRKRPEHLWDYYQENRSFMRYWSPTSGNREFGYAFAELFVRNYILKRGFDRLRQAYGQLSSVERKISSRKKRTDVILNTLAAKLNPCQRQSQGELRTCLSELRNRTYQVPVADVAKEKEEVTIPQLSYSLESEETEGGGNRSALEPQVKLEEVTRGRRDSLLSRVGRNLAEIYWKFVNWIEGLW